MGAAGGMGYLSGISDRDGVCGVNFFSHQPALNYGYYNIDRPWQQPMDADGPQKTLEEMKNVMRFWLSLGCDGFRVDMAGSLVKNDPEQKGTIALWQNVRSFLDNEYPEAAMISEWGEPDKSLAGGFHMDFLLHFGPSRYWELFRGEKPYFSSKGGDISQFVRKYLDSYNKTESKGLICIPSGNHDMERISRNLTEEERKIAFAFILTMPGAPFIYYGDEIGMRNLDGLVSVEGGYGRTAARSPMQWDDGANCGFSSAPEKNLYITVDKSADRPTAESQKSDSNSLYSEVKKLLSVRNENSVLQSTADIEFVCVKQNDYPFAYIRRNENEAVMVILNPSEKEAEFECKYNLGESIYEYGGTAEQCDGAVKVPSGFAGMYRIK